MNARGSAIISRLLAAATLLAGAGCGYRLTGADSLPPEIRTIAVRPFENQTSRPEIEQRVTEAIADELSKRGRYRVVTSTEGAQALLEGTVTAYRAEPVQFTEEGRATRVQASVTLRATLTALADDSVIWNQSGLVFREQYEVPEGGDFIDQETLALDEIARGAAGALVTSIFEGW